MKNVKKNWLEWCVFAVGSALVGGVLGMLSYQALVTTETPPRLKIEVGRAKKYDGHYALPITVHNQGSQTAEAIQIEVRLVRRGEPSERASFEMQFLPGGGSQKGWAAFHSDPNTADRVVTRPLGFGIP